MNYISTGSMFADTTNLIVCPKCNANLKESCKTPQGRKIFKPHKERVHAFYNHELYNLCLTSIMRPANIPEFLRKKS